MRGNRRFEVLLIRHFVQSWSVVIKRILRIFRVNCFEIKLCRGHKMPPLPLYNLKPKAIAIFRIIIIISILKLFSL